MRLDQGVVSSVVFAPIIKQMGRNEDEKKESFQREFIRYIYYTVGDSAQASKERSNWTLRDGR